MVLAVSSSSSPFRDSLTVKDNAVHAVPLPVPAAAAVNTLPTLYTWLVVPAIVFQIACDVVVPKLLII